MEDYSRRSPEAKPYVISLQQDDPLPIKDGHNVIKVYPGGKHKVILETKRFQILAMLARPQHPQTVSSVG
jgi:hypothetical protein